MADEDLREHPARVARADPDLQRRLAAQKLLTEVGGRYAKNPGDRQVRKEFDAARAESARAAEPQRQRRYGRRGRGA